MTNFTKRYNGQLKGLNRPKASLPKRGEVWISADFDGIKDRPVVIAGYHNGFADCLKCTSQFKQDYQRIELSDYSEAGLEKKTYVVPGLRTVTLNSLTMRLGTLTEADCKKIGL